MIIELGHVALVLALAIALIQSSLPLIGAQRMVPALMRLGSYAAVLQFLLIGIAFLALTHAFVTSDFSVAVVFENSHTDKPLLYKVTGLWGNHEGSLLLWVAILSVFGAAVACFGDNLPPALKARVLSVQAMIAVGFLLFMILTSNPFMRLDPAPLQGRGLNPLLQDRGLAFHPPFLYLGYVGFSVTFAFAIAALIEGRVDAAWARWVRPWALAAWCFLTIGITLGSWWAYYTLGWGGFWFWDPTENASFMPWLMGTALIHSALVVEKRDTLKGWTVLLAILTFSLSLLGTFLVRSGVVSSVHSFANDPARGVFILAFMLIVVGGAFTLYAWRAPALIPGGLFAPISREGALIFNNWLLASSAATVLIGTLYPLLLDAVADTKVSVGPPYFNATFGLLMVPAFLAMAVGPLLPWKRGDLGAVLSRLKFAALISVGAGLLTLRHGEVLPALCITLAVWIICGQIADLHERTQWDWRRALGLRRAIYGSALAHVGVAVTLLGITGTMFWSQEKLAALKPGETVDLPPYRLTFEGTAPVVGPNYDAQRGRFLVARDGVQLFEMAPEARLFHNPPQPTNDAAIRPTLDGDLYVALGEPSGTGWTARFYLKPLAPLIWIGGFFMAVGGALSLSDRRLRFGMPKAAARMRAQAAE
jgi:cytochrome c-type biogenesis protein CcmF